MSRRLAWCLGLGLAALANVAGALAGVEVKAAATVTAADFRGLRKLKQAAGTRFAGGVVLYDGETTAGFGDGMFAVPLRTLWEPPPDERAADAPRGRRSAR